MRFGVFLPTFLTGEHPREHAAAIRAFARRAEELGFDSLWITDHVVTARAFYGVGWLDALTTLSHVAAVTERVRLGTSILILPLRRPALLAKEIATLHYLSGERYVYGIGTGWYEPEFAACGVSKSDRGRLTDEVLEATTALLRGDRVDGITIEPRLQTPPPVWSAGGSQLPHDRSVERARMHPNVLRRIAAADGWIARPTCPPDLIAADLREIREARAGKPLTVAHENFAWIQENGDVAAVQRERFGAVMGDGRPWEYIDAVYMPGTIDAIQAKVQARIDAGVEYLMLHTLDSGLEQLELIARHVVEPFAGVAPGARRVQRTSTAAG
jgi:alkanesulfonate monooxygenase SsuD/methylene tetrahydromethanopterin reductase-like flavin-dependent oxidoreductase (luciferase family)